MLEIEDLTKSYGGLVALRNVSLRIDAGEILCLLGSNGAGKTTFISTVAGTCPINHGSIRIGGVSMQSSPYEARRQLGVAPQDLGIYLQLSVRENLMFFGRLRDLRGRSLNKRVEQLAEALALDQLLERPAQELSGGEKRRLHAAMAMIRPVPLLLLDEPTAGVDVRTRNSLLDYIKQLACDGVAICYTTHYLEEVERLAGSVAILEQGALVVRNRVDELIAAEGRTVVAVTFDCRVPSDLAGQGLIVDDSVLHITEVNAGGALKRTLAAIGNHAEQVRSVELMQPSLESVYLSLTGQKFSQDIAAAA